ncbi:MAG TPA: hypothetical protein VF533_10960, partial [Solirubrobacteraceae bacterium]|jgi:hypothetical protein
MPIATLHPIRAAATALAATAVLAGPAAAASTVAPGPGGTAYFTWAQAGTSGFQVQERPLAADGSLGPAQAVSWSLRSSYADTIGSDAAGNAVLAWSDVTSGDAVMYARRRLADGTLTPVQRISPDGVETEDRVLAVAPDGDAFLAWTRDLAGKQVLQGRRRAADGTLGPVLDLSAPGADALDPRAAVAPDGAATVVWEQPVTYGRVLQARRVAADGSLSGVRRLSPAIGTVHDPSVTVRDTGTAVVAWMRLNGGTAVVESRSRRADGTLGSLQTISPEGTAPSQPATATNAGGRVAYTWHDGNGPTQGVMGRIRQPNGALGPAFTVEAGQAVTPRVALDPEGHATFAWVKTGSTPTLRTRRRTVTGTLAPIHTVSDPSAGNAQLPSLAVDAGGKATFAWYVAQGKWFVRTARPDGTMTPIAQANG